MLQGASSRSSELCPQCNYEWLGPLAGDTLPQTGIPVQTGSWDGSGVSGAEDQAFSLRAPPLDLGPHRHGDGASLVSGPEDGPRAWHRPCSLEVCGLEGLDQGGQTSSAEGSVRNILGFGGHTVSGAALYLWTQLQITREARSGRCSGRTLFYGH